MIRPRVKASRCRLTDDYSPFLAEAATRCDFTCYTACNLFARNTDLTPTTCFILLQTLPHFTSTCICCAMCYRTSRCLISLIDLSVPLLPLRSADMLIFRLRP
ncbi:hypothetical protein TNCV_3045421 [Trichonephila clavipes]|nr:hypothetical protein TNCV_3045421 [Trichonephila clavipes]